jgi:3-phenylpropionate/trans-cinnamate dioxygenase ferredoxin subunit
MYNYKEIDSKKMEFIPVATVDELPNGERIILEIDDLVIAIFNIAGQYFAIEDVCSHDDGPVAEGELTDHEIECPRHGALFDVRTGKALTLPAVVDIPAYPIRVDGDDILLGLPVEEG